MTFLCSVCGGTGRRFKTDGGNSCYFCNGAGRLTNPFNPNEKPREVKEETTYEEA